MAGQLFGTNSLGGFYTNNELSRQMRTVSQSMKRFRAAVKVKGAKGARTGNLLYFDKNRNVATSGGQLTETNTIPETNYPIAQGTLTLNEFGLAIPWTGRLETLSEFDIEDAVQVALKNDAAKVLDSQAGAQFTSADFKAVFASTASVNFQRAGTASATSNSNLTAANWRTLSNQMRKDNIPFYDGSSYMVIGSVELISGMHADAATAGFVDSAKYTGEYASRLFSGEVGRFYMGRFVEETNYLPNTLGTGSAFGAGVAFGDDAVMEGVAQPEELRQKVPTDYGRSQGLAWYALMGWQKVWNETTDADERCVHITSL